MMIRYTFCLLFGKDQPRRIVRLFFNDNIFYIIMYYYWSEMVHGFNEQRSIVQLNSRVLTKAHYYKTL